MTFIRLAKKGGIALLLVIAIGVAHPAHAAVIRVDGSLMSSGDGSSWALAKNTLQGALAAANQGDEIWVKGGITYTPGTTAASTFQLVSDVDVYGGFAGTETLRTQADPDAYPTILSGNLGSSTFATNVVTATDTTASLTRLDGFTITNGFGGPGAGLKVVIDQITTGTVRLNVTRCKFVSNFALSASGGAVALIDDSGLFVPEIDVAFTNCKFLNNSAGNGGALYFHESANATITNCVFAGNTATGNGGALYLRRSCPNADEQCGQQVNCQAGDKNQANLNNCTFYGNTADLRGGGAWVGRGEGLNATACIFWANSADDEEDTTEEKQIADEFDCEDDDLYETVVNHSCIQGLSALGGTGNIASDPLFVNAGAGHFQLRASSLAVDAGDVGFAFPTDLLDFNYDMDTTEIAPDLDRHTRIIGVEIDMGAYERLCGCEADTVTSGTFAPPPDGVIDSADLAFLLGEWGANPGSPADVVDSRTFAPPPDDVVDAADLAWLLGSWGTCTEECEEAFGGGGSGGPFEGTEIGDLLDDLLETEDEEEAAALAAQLLELLTE